MLREQRCIHKKPASRRVASRRRPLRFQKFQRLYFYECVFSDVRHGRWLKEDSWSKEDRNFGILSTQDLSSVDSFSDLPPLPSLIKQQKMGGHCATERSFLPIKVGHRGRWWSAVAKRRVFKNWDKLDTSIVLYMQTETLLSSMKQKETPIISYK